MVYFLNSLLSDINGIVLDTFSGSGVVAHVCATRSRNFIVAELDSKFYELSIRKLNKDLFVDATNGAVCNIKQ
jgi:DNA modification methylase